MSRISLLLSLILAANIVTYSQVDFSNSSSSAVISSTGTAIVYKWGAQELNLTWGEYATIECTKGGDWRHSLPYHSPAKAAGFKTGSAIVSCFFNAESEYFYFIDKITPVEDKLFTISAISKSGSLLTADFLASELKTEAGKKITRSNVINVSDVIYSNGNLYVIIHSKTQKQFESHIVKFDRDLNAKVEFLNKSVSKNTAMNEYQLNFIDCSGDSLWMSHSTKEGDLVTNEIFLYDLSTSSELKRFLVNIDFGKIKLKPSSNGANLGFGFPMLANDNQIGEPLVQHVMNTMMLRMDEKIIFAQSAVLMFDFINIELINNKVFFYGFAGAPDSEFPNSIWYCETDINNISKTPIQLKIADLGNHKAYSKSYPGSLNYGFLKDNLNVFRIYEAPETNDKMNAIPQYIEVKD